ISIASDTGNVATLKDLLSSGYIPRRVFRNRVNGPNTIILLITFGDKQQIIAVVVGTGRVEPMSPIVELIVLAEQEADTLTGDIRMIDHFDYEVSWLGFASVDRYLSASISEP